MRLVLLAPGEANDPDEVKKWSFFTAPLPVHYVGKVFPGSAIYFPHVDSCLAIIFKLSSGSVVGGHAGIMYSYKGTEKDYGIESLRKVLIDMKSICGGQTISKVFAIGNTDGWDGDVTKEIETQCPGIDVTVEDDSPINVVADVGVKTTAIKVYDYVGIENSRKWMYGSKTAAASYDL
jgi:hypothetical protein